MSAILKHQSTTKPGRRVLVKDDRTVRKSITIKSTVTDATNSAMRTTILRPGLVLVKKTSDGLYYLSTDAAADRATAPSIVSAGHADSDNATFKLVGNHGTITVSITTNAGAEADWVTDLNADTAFKAHYVASVSGTDVLVTARAAGEQEWFYVHTDTTAGAAFPEGETNAAQGTNADYVILDDYVDMLDESATASDATTSALQAGNFFTTNLLLLTPEAKATLAQRGSIFGTT